MARTSKSNGTRNILFSSISAQADNLGDIEIRLSTLLLMGNRYRKNVIYCGTMPAGYIEMFRSVPATFLSSRLAFMVVLFLAVVRGRASLLFAPGPVLLQRNLAASGKSLFLLVVVIMIRCTGGSVFVVGRSLRGRARFAVFLERQLQHLSNFYTLRDEVSVEVLRSGALVVPDMALLSEPVVEPGLRSEVGISLRFDRGHDLGLLDELVRRCESLSMPVVLISQVRRDDEKHRSLARRWKCGSLLWENRAHVDQYDRLREFYKRADLVITDRLHVAILAASSGVVPLEIAGLTDKMQSTLGIWIDVRQLAKSVDLDTLDLAADRTLNRASQQKQLSAARAILLDALKLNAQ